MKTTLMSCLHIRWHTHYWITHEAGHITLCGIFLLEFHQYHILIYKWQQGGSSQNVAEAHWVQTKILLSSFLGCLFEVIFIFKLVFIFEFVFIFDVVLIFEEVFISDIVLIFEVIHIFEVFFIFGVVFTFSGHFHFLGHIHFWGCLFFKSLMLPLCYPKATY